MGSGQLGDGTTIDRASPVTVVGYGPGSLAQEINFGSDHASIVMSNLGERTQKASCRLSFPLLLSRPPPRRLPQSRASLSPAASSPLLATTVAEEQRVRRHRDGGLVLGPGLGRGPRSSCSENRAVRSECRLETRRRRFHVPQAKNMASRSPKRAGSRRPPTPPPARRSAPRHGPLTRLSRPSCGASALISVF